MTNDEIYENIMGHKPNKEFGVKGSFGWEDIEALMEASKKNFSIPIVSKRLTLKDIEFRLDNQIKYMYDCVQDSEGTIDPSEDIRDIEIARKIVKELFNVNKLELKNYDL